MRIDIDKVVMSNFRFDIESSIFQMSLFSHDDIFVSRNTRYISIPNILRIDIDGVQKISSSNVSDLNYIMIEIPFENITNISVYSEVEIALKSSELPNNIPPLLKQIILSHINNVFINDTVDHMIRIDNSDIRAKAHLKAAKLQDIRVDDVIDLDISKYNVENYDTTIIYNKNNRSVTNIPTGFHRVDHHQNVKLAIINRNKRVDINLLGVYHAISKDIIKIVRKEES